MTTCPGFCAIVAGEAAAIPIYEDDNYLAILDIRPFTRGHTLGRRLLKRLRECTALSIAEICWGTSEASPAPRAAASADQLRRSDYSAAQLIPLGHRRSEHHRC